MPVKIPVERAGLPFARFLRFVVLSLIIYGVSFFRMQAWIASEQGRG